MGTNVGLRDLFIDLLHIHSLEFFVHLIEQEAEEVASILLLVVRIVNLQEGLEDFLRVDHALTEQALRVKLVCLIEVFADVDELAQQAVCIETGFDVWICCDSLQQIEESRTSQ